MKTRCWKAQSTTGKRDVVGKAAGRTVYTHSVVPSHCALGSFSRPVASGTAPGLGQWIYCGHCRGAKGPEVQLTVTTAMWPHFISHQSGAISRLSCSCRTSRTDPGPLWYLHPLYYLHWGGSEGNSFYEKVPAAKTQCQRRLGRLGYWAGPGEPILVHRCICICNNESYCRDACSERRWSSSRGSLLIHVCS